MRDAVHDRECTSDSAVAIAADYRRVPGRPAGERLMAYVLDRLS
jgi:hypothetical protein